MKRKVFRKYSERVADLYDIDLDTLFSKTKRRDCVDARHLLYYLCSKRPMRLVYIQEYLGNWGYDIPHSTIHHGIKQVEKRLEQNDTDYKDTIDSILNEV